MSNFKNYLMRKIHMLLLMILLNMGLFSCTPPSVEDDLPEIQACCDEDEPILPPPPPPPPPGG